MREVVTPLTAAHRGRWAVAFQVCNEVAAKFWHTVVAELDRSFTFEQRDGPGRPALPSDFWARFGVR